MYAHEAADILRAFYPQTSTTGSFKTSKKPNKEGLSREWWLGGKSQHNAPTPRDARYLAAYDQMAKKAGKRLWATGIPLEDDFVWYDRAVMATLLAHDCVALNGEAFEITTRGRQLLAEVPPPSPA